MNSARRINGTRLALWVMGGAAVVALAVAAAGGLEPRWNERAMRNAPRPLNVLLVTLDTTRADHIGAYGWRQAETPNLDALAGQGTLFRQAYSHAPLTFPAHASLMTGLLPTRHGVRDNGTFVLPRSMAVLAERFRDAGYHAGAFVSAFVLDRRFGLARGFATYDDEVPGEDAAQGGDPSERSVRAEETVGRALAWLAAADERPRFLWVHLYDPHAPYDAPEPFAARHRDRPYDGEIAYMDAQLGRLVSALRTRSGTPWLTVVVGDHGEGLGDHQEVTHGYFVYSNTQRVPLIVALPGHVPAGRTVDEVVRGVDVGPTILELSGLPVLPDADGRSLVRVMAGRSHEEPGPAYLESFHPRIWWGAQELTALRTGRWLFIDAPRPELYDVGADPAERVNLAAARPRELELLGARLREFERAGSPMGQRARLDPEAEARLRALGYLGSGQLDPTPGTGELPDAKDNGPLLEAVTRGQDLAAQGRYQEALGPFREALQKNPRSIAVQMRIADTLLALGRYAEAFAAFGEIAATGSAGDKAYIGMSKARLGQGKADEALAVTRAGLEVTPDSVWLNTQHGELLLQLQRPAEAEQAFRTALATVPEDEAARWGLGVALSRDGRKQESVVVMLGLAEDSPHSRQGRATAEALALWADERLDAAAPQDARRGYEAVLRTGRVSIDLFLNLGLATFQSGQPGHEADALAVLERGLTRFPDSTELLYRKGRILEQLGRGAEARAVFQRVLELAPGHAGAAAAVQRRQPA